MTQSHDTPATIVKKELLTDTLFTLTVRPEKRLDFLPGQYVSIVLPGKKPSPFSIASAPSSEDLQFGIIVAGDTTAALRDAGVGDSIVLRGPFGRFTFHEEKAVCFLAGGTGLTPFMSMLRWIHHAKKDVDAVLLYSCKRREQVLWAKELLAMPGVDITLTEERSPGFHHGRIGSRLIAEKVPDFAQRTFFVCGPPGFVKAMFAALRSLDVPDSRMRKESW